jgi:hypothetical protein
MSVLPDFIVGFGIAIRSALFRDDICASGKEVKPIIGEETELIGSGGQGHGECQSSRRLSA